MMSITGGGTGGNNNNSRFRRWKENERKENEKKENMMMELSRPKQLQDKYGGGHDAFLMSRNTFAEKHTFSDFGTYTLTFDWEQNLSIPHYAKPILQIKLTGIDRERELILGSSINSKDLENVEKHLDYYYCRNVEPEKGIFQFFGTFLKYGVKRKVGDFCVVIHVDDKKKKKNAYRAQVISIQEETDQVEMYLIDKGVFKVVHMSKCWNLIRILSDICPCGIAMKIRGATTWPTIDIDKYYCEVEIVMKVSESPKVFSAAFTSTALINHQLIEAFQIVEECLVGPFINHGFNAGLKSNAFPKKQNHKNKREPPPSCQLLYPARSFLPPELTTAPVWDPSSATKELSSTNFSFASQSNSGNGNDNNTVQFMEM